MTLYKLLLVDDEQIIREGIVQLVNWDSLGIQVEDAENGIEAYEKIKNMNPDIVITDIKMPGMDGLELIERVKTEFPDIIFIILSGYGEFNFASRAMQYGVKYYLLKPCDEDEITKVLYKVTEELKQNKERQKFIKKMEEDLQRVIPYVKEQFFRDCVMGRLKDEKDVVYFKELLKLPAEKMRLLLFRLDDNNEFEKRFALKNLLDYCEKDYSLLSTIIGENVLLLQKAIPPEKLFSYLEEIKQSFINYCGISFTVAVSSEGFFEQLPDLYDEVMECLEYRFYLGEDCIITRDDVGKKEQSIQSIINFDYQHLALLIRSGNVNAVCKELKTFFTKLNSNKVDADMVRALCIELYISIIRQAKLQDLNEYMKQISVLQDIATLDKMFNFIMSIAQEITEGNYKENQEKNSQIIKTVLKVIEENINFEDLSLSWIAEKIVYMNVDYLGKLFKKEVGKNFSAYLMEKRVEKAKQLLSEESYCKISDIAKCVGYGNNPQYFGQVFKKITGYTPSEYKKMLGCQK
nr:response regulator [Caldicoprobacter algeriensis]